MGRMFELLSLQGKLSPEMDKRRLRFAEGLEAYRKQAWPAAEMIFQELVENVCRCTGPGVFGEGQNSAATSSGCGLGRGLEDDRKIREKRRAERWAKQCQVDPVDRIRFTNVFGKTSKPQNIIYQFDKAKKIYKQCLHNVTICRQESLD